ncbi:tripartite tricarboxylate transporter substrate binding protein [Paracoccus caeni]|uniref:Tripartite tricarboxylate transporter substrate binding protein n=1 Tax=Paracoccus caeni TaxID=657651 RepID=A0A934SHG8_9RHOB|nr:tripartite tricarboxylate transporter substrate binding protein [Paracoccus caeni]MBK4217932.1 tripartite tricarboxylate transporter substrate binding protein [Paracoccus caeni]
MKAITLIATATLGLFAVSASAQDYPDRPITLIVPWGAGGGSDATARIVATLLEEKLGQPINVVNRAGGGSVIGHTEIANAKPDGYTLGNITTELSMFHWLGQSPVSYQDYTPIGLFNADFGGIFVAQNSPYESLQDLVDALREDASAIPAGGANQGGVNHLAYAALVAEAGGSQAFWVPSEGAAPALQLLTSGAIQAAIVQFPEARALMDAGEIRPLATLNNEREPSYPDVPTVAEASDVNVSISGWRGLAGPKDMPQEVVDSLSAALEEIVASDEYKEFMASRQFTIAFEGGDAFGTYLAERDTQFGDALKAAGLVAE